jgi:ABC-type nickel/cobalt efflux system permease component RcnA
MQKQGICNHTGEAVPLSRSSCMASSTSAPSSPHPSMMEVLVTAIPAAFAAFSMSRLWVQFARRSLTEDCRRGTCQEATHFQHYPAHSRAHVHAACTCVPHLPFSQRLALGAGMLMQSAFLLTSLLFCRRVPFIRLTGSHPGKQGNLTTPELVFV